MKNFTWVTLASKPVIIGLAVIGLLLTIVPFTSQAAPKTPAWRAEYYNNNNLSGQPKISRYESSFGHDWGTNSPAMEIPKDHFSARWTNTVHLQEGTYLFVMTVDDGARVWLNGRLIINAWDIGRIERHKSKVRVDKSGNYEIQVAYFEQTGNAAIHMEWFRLGGQSDIVGAWHGQYFNNKNLTGTPVMVRQDGGINFNWDYGSPHPEVPRDNFSVRWTRSIYAKEGLYHFRVQHDDGLRIYIDDKIVYESWFDQEVTYKTGVIPLKEGYRTFVVEYYDHTANAIAYVSFDEDPGNYDVDAPEPQGAGIIVDNNSGRFKWSGPNGDRSIATGGFGDDFYWTYNTNRDPINSGQWTPPLTSAGNYEILAYIPGTYATTTNARYRIHHYGRIAERKINQNSYSNQFVSLGIYYFNADGSETVTLYDNTSEAASNTSVAFDALKFVKR